MLHKFLRAPNLVSYQSSIEFQRQAKISEFLIINILFYSCPLFCSYFWIAQPLYHALKYDLRSKECFKKNLFLSRTYSGLEVKCSPSLAQNQTGWGKESWRWLGKIPYIWWSAGFCCTGGVAVGDVHDLQGQAAALCRGGGEVQVQVIGKGSSSSHRKTCTRT